jgi:hypothetical protein
MMPTCPSLTPYRLRHTWATTLRAGGLNFADVQTLLGHTSSKTTEGYAVVAPHKLMGLSVLSLELGYERVKTSTGNEPKPSCVTLTRGRHLRSLQVHRPSHYPDPPFAVTREFSAAFRRAVQAFGVARV